MPVFVATAYMKNGNFRRALTGVFLLLATRNVTADIAIPTGYQHLPAVKQMGSTPSVDAAPTLWTNKYGLTREGSQLLDEISNVYNEGFDPERYQLHRLRELTAEAWNPARRGSIDQLLSTAFEQLVTDLGQGLFNPREVQQNWFQTPQEINPESAYEVLQVPGNSVSSVLDYFRPHHSLYHHTVQALLHYRTIAEAGGWPTIPGGQSLRMGDLDERVPLIEQRLLMTGDLAEIDMRTQDEKAVHFSHAAMLATKHFQQRHGLEADGIIGPKTLKAMNIPVSEKIEKLEINLERLRWLPRDLGTRHILTNIPEFKLRLYDHGLEILNMRVITGQKKFKTPVFSDELEYLVVNPTWTVPRSILHRDLLPAERRNPGYLARKNFELITEENGQIITRDPNSISHYEYSSARFPYTLRQKPGEKNALGKVKFIFPNKYSIYMHDTPAKDLFDKTARAFSNGCVRVADPRGLARTLLEFDGWDEERFERAFAKKQQKYIHLDETVKTHITYLTSWADQEGVVHFRKDLYDHDSNLANALRNVQKISWPSTLLAELEK